MNAYDDYLEHRFAEGASGAADVAAHPLIAQTLARRTVRRYTDQMPDDKLLDLLTAAALSASSKSDFQQASILRVTDAGIRRAIGELFPAMPWIGASPVFYVFLGDARRLQRIGALRGKPVDNSVLEGFFNASVDAALAMQTFLLCAESAGLGCCPISVIRNRVDEVAALLGLPDQVFPVVGLCVGYASDAGHVSLRLPRAITVHHNRYDDSNLAANIDQYDQSRHARHALNQEQQRGKATWGLAEFYGWSEDKARQASEAEGAAFPVYLKAHGFSF
jgi:FMN reductase [NAD(P)H]